jgi:hypothetical protein
MGVSSVIKFTVFPTKSEEQLCSKGTIKELESFESLKGIVTETAWSAGQFKGNHRKKENFIGCDFIAIDIDKGCSLADALNIHFKDFQHIIYTSKNHLKEKKGVLADRFRVLLAIDRPILTNQEYDATWATLLKRWPFIDPQAKDSSRFFFPGTFQSVATSGQTIKTVSCLSHKTRDFLTNGAPDGTWNSRLFKAAKDMQEQLYTEEQALKMLELPTKLPGNFGALDKADLACISNAFSKAPRYLPRRSPVLTEIDEEGNARVDYEQLCRDLLDANFVQQVTNDATLTYTIEEPELREVLRCMNEDVISRHVAKELNELLKSGALPTDAKKLLSPAALIKFWRQQGDAITEEPAPFGWPDQDGWTIKRLAFMPTAGEYPAWSAFLNRLSDHEAFMAFVWSCFDPKSKSRQSVWLHGPTGQDGKSTILRVIASCFGNAAAALNNSQISSDSRFTLANFYNKRVAIYPDAKNRRFPMTELFRSLTSGDVVPIEFKGQGTVNTVLYIKLMIASNYEPDITMGNADMSRLIRIDVEESPIKDDGNWEEELQKELPYFLHACREVYQRLCPNHGQIAVNDETRELVLSSSDELYAPLEYFFNEHFVADAEGTITAADFYNFMRRHEWADADIGRFKQYLLDVHKVRKQRLKKSSGRGNAYLGVRLKNSKADFKLKLHTVT